MTMVFMMRSTPAAFPHPTRAKPRCPSGNSTYGDQNIAASCAPAHFLDKLVNDCIRPVSNACGAGRHATVKLGDENNALGTPVFVLLTVWLSNQTLPRSGPDVQYRLKML